MFSFCIADARFDWPNQNVNTDGQKNDWLFVYLFTMTSSILLYSSQLTAVASLDLLSPMTFTLHFNSYVKNQKNMEEIVIK